MTRRRRGDLSGGQQLQRTIARAMIMRSKVLLLDGPTQGIQPNISQQIGRVITCRKSKGYIAIILVKQYFDFGCGLADLFHVLRRGASCHAGQPGRDNAGGATGRGHGLKFRRTFPIASLAVQCFSIGFSPDCVIQNDIAI